MMRALIKDQKGMSLVEAAVAVLIFGVVTLPLIYLFQSGNAYTGAARHEVAALNSAQQIMEQIKGSPYKSVGLARDGATPGTIVLGSDAGSLELSGIKLICITAGNGAGQVRRLTGFDSYTKVASINMPWDLQADGTSLPDHTSTYLLCDNGSIFTGLARSGGSDIIQLASNESNRSGFFNDFYIEICGGRGAGQTKKVINYDGNKKTAQVETCWDEQPDSTSLYRLYRYKYSVEIARMEENLKTVSVRTYYPEKNIFKEVSLTTDKLKR